LKSLTLGERPELRIDPTNILTTGPIANVTGAQVCSVEAAANYGPLLVQGEYYFYNVDRALGLSSLRFNGGDGEAGWGFNRDVHRRTCGGAGSSCGGSPSPLSFG